MNLQINLKRHPPGVSPDVKLNVDSSPSASREGGSVKQQKCDKSEHWGDRWKTKSGDVYRLVLNNVNSIGLYAGGLKDKKVRQFLEEGDVDVYGMTEPNVNWGKVKKKDNWWERTESWFETRRLSVAYNTHRGRLAKRSQYGGTITMCRNGISYRSPKSAHDPSGLGRWSSICFRGKKGSKTRVVTAYCPTPSSNGPHTVYSQHLKYLDKDPIQAFRTDLGQAISKWHQDGEQLILMGDWNQETQSEEFISWYSKLGLVDSILQKHGDGAPATYNKGSRRIDAILISATLRISKCGYLPFDSMPGDHRVLYIDIKVKHFIGHRPADIPSHQARRLKLDDPRIVLKYQEELEQLLTKSRIFPAVRSLQKYVESKGLFDEKAATEFERIDNQRERCMKQAERKCRKLKMGGKQWSPILQASMDTIQLWTLVLRRLVGRKIGARYILRLKKKLKIKHTLVTISQAQKKIDDAYKVYKALCKEDRKLSQTYRMDLAQAKADAGNSTLAGIIRGLDAKETQRKNWRRIQYTLGTKGGKGTSKIEIELPDGTIKEITDPDEMNEYIVDENREKFHQTRNCPLLFEQLLADLGLMGDGPEAINVLNGTYIPPEGTSWATTRWLQQMKITHPVARQEIVTSLKEYRQGWKKAKERTASGELHMGHFKAAAVHKKLGWMNFVLSVLPYTAGYVPKRWQKGTDVMLLKKEELFLLTKLRTIVLYEADYNHENKRLGRTAMKLAIKNNHIAPEQFSRPSRNAQENVICKRLVFDYCRGKKKPFGMCACDLKSCYDRIVHTAASLALQRIGIPVGQIRSMFGAVQKLVHRIRTLYGDSDCFYGGEHDCVQHDLPPQGSGQGNGAGPTIWSVLSSTIFEILNEEGFSTQFCHSISKGLYELCGFSYVDDCDLFHVGDDVTDVHSQMQAMLTMWDELMEVNGAAIAPEKCWWYLADFKWSKGRCRMIDAGKDTVLQVRDKNQKMQALTNLPLSEAKEMLGVFLAPDGNEKKAAEALTHKIAKWTTFISSGGLDWFSTWLALKNTIMKSLCYSLPALTLTPTVLEDIVKPLHAIALPRSGYCRTFPKKVLYGPSSFQGLGLDNLLTEQYVTKIKAILDYMQKNATSGNMIQSNLEITKLEAGIPGPLFEYDGDLSFLTGAQSWIAETKDFCWDYDIFFAEKGDHLKKKCVNDELIMDIFLKRGNYSVATLRALNRCRFYLQVSTLSDITSGDGKFILNHIWTGYCRYTTDSFDWPNQGNPPSSEWTLWAREIKRHFAPERGRLQTPLGDWTIASDKEFYTDWEWWLDHNNNLFHYEGSQWHSITGYKHRSSIEYSSHSSTVVLLSEQPQTPLFRSTVSYSHSESFIHNGFRHRTTPPLLPSWPSISLLDHIKQVSSDSCWLFQHFKIHLPLIDIIRLLYSGQLTAVSDGSFHPGRKVGSTAWCLSTIRGHIVVEGGGLIPGTKDNQSAYRSEAGGILGSITFCQIVENLQPPEEQYNLTIACDGEGALYQCLQLDPEKVSSKIAHADMISRIQDRKKSLHCIIKPVHVMGHQEKTKKNLSMIETLNVKMDDLAERIMTYAKHNHIRNLVDLPLSEDGLPRVQMMKQPIQSEFESTIRKGVNSLHIKNWWIEKGRYKLEDEPFIDWKAMEYCMDHCTSRYKRFIPKWVARQIAVGKVMRHRQARVHNRCPRCNAFVEDTTHVLRCQTAQTRIKWELLIQKLSDWMTKVQTMPAINIALCATLRYWRNKRNSGNYIDSDWDRSISKVFCHQASLGWQNMLEGIISTGWATLQQNHYNSIRSMKKGQKWIGSLSIELWKMVYGMWEHRNKALFESEKISEYQGSAELKKACLVEIELGLGNLDALYHPYIDTTAETLFEENLDYQRNWFSIVRQAREKKLHIYDDIFSKCNNTRAWAGLNPLQCSDDNNSVQ